MATQETRQLDEIISSRRAMMLTGGIALAGLMLPRAANAAALTDNDVLNFALNLEYLEAQFYNLAAFGVTIDKLPTPIPVSVNGGTAGTVTVKPSFAKVPFSSPVISAYAAETAVEERKHVTFLQGALGSAAVSMPNLDLYHSFNTLASAAGIGSAFDPFAHDADFLIGAYIFEDVGVTAYHGAAGAIQNKGTLGAAAGILAVEAYHAGLIRTALNQLDPTGALGLLSLTQKISATRSKLANPSGTPVDDIGLATINVSLNASASTYPALTFVDADSNSIAFARTPTQVLAIVTGGASNNQGVFFPNGLNGTIK
ncbi:ferritin-like domain-containing protein [Edaphobacter sp.]|uniref:ferritin-like domain-containing protein n=1 Tax=Edaphobacter sp. TaxID=1934404 RepID=UPI002DB78953|nr:ferritin-like domain-containing protein [Edaphobacter sp.]HEU5341442.1 ferritin-like domain-containing protein [Edaphobacter sp.]